MDFEARGAVVRDEAALNRWSTGRHVCAHAKTSAPASSNHRSIFVMSVAWSGLAPPGRWSDEKAQPFAQPGSPVICELFLPLSRLPSMRVSLSLRTAASMAWRWCGAHPHAIDACQV